MKKYLSLILIICCVFLFACEEKYPELNKEVCKEYCEECPECQDCPKINNETCKEYCEECEVCSTCPECQECPELNKETCKEHCEECEVCPTCPECPEINEETCKELIDAKECPAPASEETCKEFITSNKQKVYLGIDLIDENMDIFKNKRVGLITNPTGVNSEYKSTIDVLFEKVNLVSLFAPEHGIRGNAQAGGGVQNEIDAVTGLTVYSLYGNTKAPTAEMMNGIDVLCIDIQDVGARFYTYIYTMVYAMQACKQYGKTFVIFDRPNPIGNKVDGNILDMKYSSFVGMYDIITRHGLTIGELALLFNSEYNINCNLKVVKMKDYDPSLYIDETTAPWINPSPNMPTLDTAIVYTGTCYFEGLNLSEGRGTTKPFEFIGAPFIDPYKWIEELNKVGLEGVVYRPVYFTPTFEDFKGEQCGGIQVICTDREKFSACKVAVAMIYTVKKLYPSQTQLLTYLRNLTGVDYIYNMSLSLNEVFSKIDNDIITFSNISNKYKLYK